MNRSEQINEIATALNKAQSEMVSAKKDAENPYFKSKYADLASVWESCQKPLTKNGLSVTQVTSIKDNGLVILQTTLFHTSGQWIQGEMPVVPQKQDPQTLGSLLTYLRRYSLAAIVGVVTDDDDAESSMNRYQKNQSVFPEQPSENDGKTNLGGYKVPFGKFANRSLEEIDINELRSYIVYLENQAVKKNKPIVGQVKEFIDRACDHISAFENSPIEQIDETNNVNYQ